MIVSSTKRNVWLGVGIGSIALTLGYMVGASATPVAGVAIPAVFGLVITALGFLGGSGVEGKLDAVKEMLSSDKSPDLSLGKSAVSQAQDVLDVIQERLIYTPELIGKMLLVFTLFYIAGLAFGTATRLNSWFVPPAVKDGRRLPWESNSSLPPPPTASDAIDWVDLQEQLLELNYNQEQIERFYSLQFQEWERARQQNSNSNTPMPAATPGPSPDQRYASLREQIEKLKKRLRERSRGVPEVARTPPQQPMPTPTAVPD